MPSLDDLYDELRERNEKVTVQVRTLTLGLLAFIAAILMGLLGLASKDFHPTLPVWAEMNLLLVAAALFLVLLVDLVQSVLSLSFIDHAIDDAEVKIEKKEMQPTADIPLIYTPKYNWAWRLFWAKIYLLVLVTVWFATVTVVYCINHLH